MNKIKEVLSGSNHQSPNTSQSTPSQGYSSSSGPLSGGGPRDSVSSTAGQTESTTGYKTGPSGSVGSTGSTGYNTGANSTTTDKLPAVGSGSGRAEENLGSSRQVTGSTGNFSDPHSVGHDATTSAKFDPSAATTHHDHKHLNHVTQRDVRHVEVEEVERQKEHERHIHHVQHHVQPILDKQVRDEVHHNNAVPVTEVREQHVNTEEDRQLFQGLATKHHDSETHRGKERTVVDMGERVTENVQHHVHHVTQPVVQQEVIDRHRIHTVIPTHHVTHEAPIIHKSSVHEPVAMQDFLQGGGKLGSGITHENAGVLQNGECVREVDGVGEKLATDLNLRSGSLSDQHNYNSKV